MKSTPLMFIELNSLCWLLGPQGHYFSYHYCESLNFDKIHHQLGIMALCA